MLAIHITSTGWPTLDLTTRWAPTMMAIQRERSVGRPETTLIPSLHTQRRIVGVTMGPRCEESASVRRIEQRIARKPRR